MGFLGERNRKLAPNWHRAIPAFFRLRRRRVRERPQTAETTKCDRRRPRVPHSVFLVGRDSSWRGSARTERTWPGRPTALPSTSRIRRFCATGARRQYTPPKQDQKWRARDLVDIHWELVGIPTPSPSYNRIMSCISREERLRAHWRLGIHQWPSMSAPGLAPRVSSFGQD